MRLWWWRKVRVANISREDRDLFERFGEAVVGTVVAGGFNPRHEELQKVYTDPTVLANAAAWLTERGDLREQREQRLETVEWAVLVLTVLATLVALHLIGR